MNRTRADLLRSAGLKIQGLVDYDPKCGVAVPDALALLEQIVLDDQPTPQPTYYDQGVEVSWLVNDWYVGLLVDADEWVLWAVQPDHTELFEIVGKPGTLLKAEELRWTRHVLAEMGKQVTQSGMWRV